METCRSKLAEYYKNSGTVPTSVWSTLDPVDIHEIYTRLSWEKQEENAAGSSQTELEHYSDLFAANKSGTFPKRILVQGQTGIGKTTFVKKLALDWAELNLDDEKAVDKKTVALKRFELLVAVNLKEVSKHQSLKDVISCSNIFGEEDKSVTDGLLKYITDNQNKVLLVFDGYDEYRCGRDSDIFKIFKGDKLRDCCVLITSRISKADDLRENRVLKLLRAKILGFSDYGISSYMKRKLGSDKDAETLLAHLREKDLLGLAESPLLLLFLCILWKDVKEGHLESWPETKTDLYEQIVQSILDHNQAKDSASCDFREVKDFKEILCEIGKVALDCLLMDDHVFDYNRLPSSISRQESSFFGLLQLTKCIGRRRPAGMVSFMHKSIQEFLSAWYITYRWIIPEETFGPVEKHARTFDGCVALENVLQFVCGLSDKGAAKVFKHLESVRTSDQSVDLTTTVPDVEKETDEPLSEVTEKHRIFYRLVRNSFHEVKSKALLSRNCFDCFGGVFFSTDPLSELLKLMDCNSFSFHFTARFSDCLELFKLLAETFESLKNETTEFPEICDFVKGFVDVECPLFPIDCNFRAILTYHCGRVHFYIRDLRLLCCNHATVFFESGQVTKVSDSSSLFNFLTRVRLSDDFMDNCIAEKYWEIVRNYGKRLNKIEIRTESNWLVRILQEIPRPAEKCSLKIGSLRSQQTFESLALTFTSRLEQLTSEGAEQLALLLPQFKSEISLFLNMGSCSSLAAETLVQSITHEQLQDLVFEELTMTPALAAALGQSLPKLTSLRMLKLGCVRNSIRQVVDAKLLFGLSKLAHLAELYLSCFNMQENFITFIQSLQSSPNLMRLELLKLNLNGNDVCSLLESVSHHNPRLQGLGLQGNPLGDSVTSIIPYMKNLPSLSELWIDQMDCSEEGWRNLTEAYEAQPQFYIRGSTIMTSIF